MITNALDLEHVSAFIITSSKAEHYERGSRGEGDVGLLVREVTYGGGTIGSPERAAIMGTNISKVGDLMIRSTSGDRDQCDLTHKPRYFDEKPEWGGSSHEMMEITVCIVDG